MLKVASIGLAFSFALPSVASAESFNQCLNRICGTGISEYVSRCKSSSTVQNTCAESTGGASSSSSSAPQLLEQATYCGKTYEAGNGDSQDPSNVYYSGHDLVRDLRRTDTGFGSAAASDFNFDRIEGDDWGSFSLRSRVLNALWLIKNAADPDSPAAYGLNGAYEWAAPRIDRLRWTCNMDTYCDADSWGCNVERKEWNTSNENTIYLSPDLIFGTSVIDLAATIIHEARHSDQSTSDNVGTWLSDGDPHGGWPHGPNAYEAKWEAWFATGSSTIWPNDFRDFAAQRAQGQFAESYIQPNFDGRLLRGHHAEYADPYAMLGDFKRRMPPAYMSKACQDSGRYYDNAGGVPYSVAEDSLWGPTQNQVRSYCGSCGWKKTVHKDAGGGKRYITWKCNDL